MKFLIRAADTITEWCGNVAALCCVLLVALMFGLVVARHSFAVGSIAAQELTQWLHGAAFLLALAYGFKYNSHVRVDIFSQRWSKRQQALMEMVGIFIFLLPLCVFWCWVSFDYVAVSWAQREGSNSGGLPGWFLIKTLIPLSAVLLILQAFAHAVRTWQTFKSEAKA
jgi:TRAP-type mannitol/chloroaromatic compound transport system permease small subunit